MADWILCLHIWLLEIRASSGGWQNSLTGGGSWVGVRLFFHITSGRRRGKGLRSFRLDIWKNVFTKRGVKDWHGLPREVLESLEGSSDVQVWPLGAWGSGGGTAGLDSLRGLFQRRGFCDSLRLHFDVIYTYTHTPQEWGLLEDFQVFYNLPSSGTGWCSCSVISHKLCLPWDICLWAHLFPSSCKTIPTTPSFCSHFSAIPAAELPSFHCTKQKIFLHFIFN